ncbi:hypothetical protein KQ298_07240 [Synechococcus sp. CS-1330]|nr:hypothetical protein [Synechococcus sp. CS-1330]
MKSNFLHLHPKLAEPLLRRWAPALLGALICQVLLLMALPQHGSDGRRARRAVLAEDTITLLRWIRTAPGLGAASSWQPFRCKVWQACRASPARHFAWRGRWPCWAA